MKPLLHVFLALGLLAPGAVGARPAPDSLDQWLARLASGSASERESAQRWLAVNLQTSDFPDLARLARRADAEMARRLALALAAEDRHLGLAVLLQGEEESALVAIGEAAFEELVTRWCPGSAGKSITRRRVEVVLDTRAELRFIADRRSESVGRAVDRYDRLLDFGVPLVTLPGVAGREIVLDSKEGHMLEHLGELCSDNGLTFTGIGDWEQEEPGRNAWILVSPLSGARSRSGAARLARWCRSVDGGRSDAAASARALAATGWPAALFWLDQRWSERRDANALEGLIAAAALGRVAPGLRRPELRAELLGRADLALDSFEASLDRLDPRASVEGGASQREAEAIARALIGAGAMTLGGEARSRSWFANWDQLNDAQRWLRLHVLEGQRAGAAAEREFLMARIESAEPGPAALRLQALRALAAFPRAPQRAPRVARLGELVRWAIETDEQGDLLIVLDALGVEPAPDDIGASTDEQRFLVTWRLSRGEAQEAAAGLTACLGRGDVQRRELSELLRAWRLEFGPRLLRQVVELALAQAGDARGERLTEVALLGGCLGVRAQRSFFESLAGEAQLGARELEWLGALAAGPAGSQAQELLLETLDDPPGDGVRRNGLVRGFDRAVQSLQEAGLEERSRELIQAVWERVAESRSPLLGRLGPPAWPRYEPALVLDLDRLERELPRGLLGP